MSAAVLRKLRFFAASWNEDKRTDVELLQQFIQAQDERAFSTLVGRHSELVWGVCHRVLRNRADAEDAIQVTFLRLARDAERIVNREALSGWLFRVARCCAIDLQRSNMRQRRIEARLVEVAARAGESQDADLRMLLDDELAQLPASERAVLVLCCLEGWTYAEASMELGCSIAAVHRRVVRAQAHLRRRLAERGPEVAGLLVAVFAGTLPASASAAPPAILADIVDSGLAVIRSGQLPAGRLGALAAATISAGGSSRFVYALAAVACATLLAGGGYAWRTPAPAGNPVAVTVKPSNPVAAIPPDHRTPMSGVVRGPNGDAVAGANVVVLARRPFAPGERGLRDDVIATATTDRTGRFDFRVPDDFDTWFAGRLVTVQASGPDFAPVTQPIRLRAGAEPVELRLGAASPLRGKLLDAAGLPGAGIRVEVVRIGGAVAEPVVGESARSPHRDWPSAVTTGADGGFEFKELGGSANVWVRIDDARFAHDVFRIDGAKPEFRLEDAHPLAVEVLADDTGASLAGARVTVIADRMASHPHFCATDFAILGPHSIPADIDAVTDRAGRVRVGMARGDRAEVLVYPPAGAGPYVGVRVNVEIGSDPKGQRLVVRLPRGRWVTGTVCTAAGRPMANAAVHWGRESAKLPEWRDEYLVGRDVVVRTGADGKFQLAVLPGANTIRVYGASLDFAPVPTKIPGTANGTLFAHRVAAVNVPVVGDSPELTIRLRELAPLTGTVERTGADSGATFLLASGRVSPVRGYAAIPLPATANEFSVPGCRPGYSTRVYLLDPKAKVGAVVDVVPGSPLPTAKLLTCGTIRLRVVDRDGIPRVGQEVSLTLLVDRDCAADATGESTADAQPVDGFDAVNYPAKPKTNGDGRVELPALIPGARYAIAVGTGKGKIAVGKFRMEAGQSLTVPDVTMLETPDGGSR